MTTTTDQNSVPQFAVTTGNLADGHTFYGPFPNRDAALIWAERNRAAAPWKDWLIIRLESEVEPV